MGIFAIIFPMILLYVSLRLFARSRYSWIFVAITVLFPIICFFILSMSWSVSSFQIIYDLLIPFILSGFILLPIMRYRRTWLNTGKWSVYETFKNHYAIYGSSLSFYFFIIFYAETLSFKTGNDLANLLFYVFVLVLTIYYLILGFGIAAVGKEIKKRRKVMLSGQ